MIKLTLLQDGEERPAITLGPYPRHLGRAPDNDCVLDHPTVSGHHASLWVESGRVFVRDRGSRNGTFVNGRQVRLSELVDGDRLKVGSVELVVRGVPAGPERAWLLEDVGSGVRYPFRGGRLVLGSGGGVDLRVDVPEDDDVSLVVHDDGEVWRSSLGAEGPLAAGEVLVLGSRRFRVIPAEPGVTATVELSGTHRSYRLEVVMSGVTGVEATLSQPDTDHRYVVSAENRAVLLYLLARARTSPDVGDDDGWIADDEVAVGIWGRRGTIDANALHVLVHRVRRELKKAGFEPWFIEKRRRAIRLALEDVVIH